MDYQSPKFKKQLRGGTWPLLAVVAIVNVILGDWAWHVLRKGHAGGRIAVIIGAVGLFMIDLIVVGLMLYARKR